MSKMEVVYFKDNRARILINPTEVEIDALNAQADKVFIQPNLSRVRGFPPELWDYEGDRIVVKSSRSMAAKLHEAPRSAFEPIIIEKPSLSWKAATVWFVIGLVIGIIGGIYG